MNLEHYKKALLFKQQDVSGTPLVSTAQQLSKYLKANTSVGVEEEAILFYLLNDAFGRLGSQFDKKENLSEEADALARLYLKKASESSARLFYYILTIITREARHAPSHCIAKLDPQYKITEFIKGLKSNASSSTAADYMKDGCASTLSGVSLGEYVAGIVDVFKKWGNPNNFGGKPWAEIAEVLRKVVFGEISLELMNDLSWSLAHNNGPMFNKGMLYDHYTKELLKILDVQRSGQIREYVANGELGNCTHALHDALSAIDACLPCPDPLYVDWFKVEALGALGDYPSEKAKQVAAHGAYSKAYAKKQIYVTPKSYASVIERSAA